MTEVFPRRNLGRGEHWGYTVERRLEALNRRHQVIGERVQGFDRYSIASAEDLRQAADDTMELAQQVEGALLDLPRYFVRSTSKTNFAVGPGWTNVLSMNVPGIAGFTRTDVNVIGTAHTVQEPITTPTGNLFDWPFPLSSVTSEYGPRPPLPFHRGIDFGQATGTPVRAAADGVVSLRGYYSDWGNYIRIRHDEITGINDCWTGYAHLVDPALFGPGTAVSKGQIIGYVGSTGLSTGPHLHFETATEGQRGDPRLFMDIWDGGGGIALSYVAVEARLVINNQVSAVFRPYTEVGIGPNQMNFPLYGRNLLDADGVNVLLQLRIPGHLAKASSSNRATLLVRGGFS